MPEGSNPTRPRPDGLRRLGTGLGIIGLLFDAGEMIEIFVAQPGAEDATAFLDVLVTWAASTSMGQSYVFEKPHPDVPRMIGFNQDVLVTAGDLFIAAGGKGIGTFIAPPAGLVVGRGIDVITTGASLVYDYSRVYGSTPNYVTVGLSTDSSSFPKGVIIIWP